MSDAHASSSQPAAEAILKLLEIMARLRDPQSGCPWDLKQTFASIVPYTLEEAYEVADAIERNDLDELQAELGDLLFQVVFYAQMASEQGCFDFASVAEAISDKLVRRHPHVFDRDSVASAEEQTERWEAYKARERRDKGRTGSHRLLHDIPTALPALTRAAKLQRRAARVGMDWPDRSGPWHKLHEELAELEVSLDGEPAALEEEFGDLLFTCVNLGRHLDLDPEQALRRANRKFETRIGTMETALEAEGRAFDELDAAALDVLWERSKTRGE